MERVDVEQWRGREVARLLALVETERRYYQEIVASLPIGLAVVSRDGAIQSANRAFRVIFNLRPEDVYRRTVGQIIDSPQLVEAIRAITPTGAPASRHSVSIASRKLLVSVTPVRDWDNDLDIEALLIIEDFTNVETPIVLDALPEPAPVPEPVAGPAPVSTHEAPALMWTGNPETMEFTAVAGIESGVVHPGLACEPIHPDDREGICDFYKHALATPGTHAYEYRGLRDGQVFWYRDVFNVYHTPTKHAAGVVSDITQRRQLELVNRQAGRLDALTTLSRTLTHDLNNPLMIVTGYGEDLLASLGAADTRRNDVQEILAAANRIGGITSQLLNFTRKQANPAQAVPVAAAVESALAGDPAPVAVPAELQVLADPTQLSEVIAALLAKLKQQGPVSISARPLSIQEHLADGPATGSYIQITLAVPGGTGISFDSLIPGKDTGGPEVARAHLLVREWGGGIWQIPGEVHVILPAAETLASPVVEPVPAPEPAPEPPAPVQPAPEPEPEPSTAEAILVVEDEGGIRALVRKILRRQNYEVIEAASAEEALTALAAHKGKLDLLITDMTLPGRNGRQLADHLQETRPGLKVLYVSGYTDDPSVYEREQLPAGAAFLQKPFTLGSLLSKVREVLDAQ